MISLKSQIKSICYAVIMLMMFSCTDGINNDEISIVVKIEYPLHPWEEFIVQTQNDSIFLEYRKLYHEMDIIYKISSDPYRSYRRVIKEKKEPDFFSLEISSTDSIYASETIFEKDASTNQLVVKENNRTQWTLIDSLSISEAMLSYKKKLVGSDLEKIVELIEQFKAELPNETEPCLDGTTTILSYRRDDKSFNYEHLCDYSENESLNDLVDLLSKLK